MVLHVFIASLTLVFTYLFMEYCVSGLQDMLDSATAKKFPIWQAHG